MHIIAFAQLSRGGHWEPLQSLFSVHPPIESPCPLVRDAPSPLRSFAAPAQRRLPTEPAACPGHGAHTHTRALGAILLPEGQGVLASPARGPEKDFLKKSCVHTGSSLSIPM